MSVDMGTSEVLDSPFIRASLLVLSWLKKHRLLWGRTHLSILCCPPGSSDMGQTSLLHLSEVLQLGAVLSSTLELYALSSWPQVVLLYFGTYLHNAHGAIFDLKYWSDCYLAKERLFCYHFNSLSSILLIIYVNKKYPSTSCLFSCFWLMFHNVISQNPWEIQFSFTKS